MYILKTSYIAHFSQIDKSLISCQLSYIKIGCKISIILQPIYFTDYQSIL